MSLLTYIFYYYIITNLIYQTYCSDVNITKLEQLTSDIINDFEFENTLDVSDYTLYFKSYHFIWNNYNEWTWNSSYNNSINTTIACSKTLPSLCINTQFVTNPSTKQLNRLKSMTVYHTDDIIPSNNVKLDFWHDLDWSQVNIFHHNDPKDHTTRRQLLRGTLSSKYGQEYYYYDDVDTDTDTDDYEFAAHMQDESQINSMQEMNDYLFNQDDDIEDIYNMDDYYKYYDRMSAAEWGVFKKIWKGIKRGARAIGNRVGIYARPPCSGSSRCRVHLYNKRGFRKRANKKGHFCEGRWDRWRLHKYRVNRRKISSIKVQGSPCCVAIAYNGNKFDGDLQAMFPRGRYRSMKMGLSTSMGMGNGMNGMGGGGMMGMMGGGMGMMGAGMNGFRDRALASMKIVHDCKLRQRLMRRGMGRAGMWGGMHGGMGGGMGKLMQMMMMMKMMFPGKGKHKGRRHTMCRYYSCIVKTQQSQLQQLMQMMMMGAMANQAPITISDNTKVKPGGKRRMIQGDNMHVVGVKKCKMLYYKEICVTFDAVYNVIVMDYTVQDRKEVKVEGEKQVLEVSDALTRVQNLVDIFSDVFSDDDDDDVEEEEDEFYDIENWIDPDPDPFDIFLDYIDPQLSTYTNRYYDDVLVPYEGEGEGDDEFIANYDRETEETQHRIRKFLGPLTYGMLKNELIFADDFGYDMEYSYLNIASDNDMIDYFDTFILEWDNSNDWDRQVINETNGIKIQCNDIILSYICYSICMNEVGEIYFNKNEEINENIYNDKGLKIFYEKTNFMIAQELQNTRLSVLNDRDWSEIYEIVEDNEDKQRKKVCNYISMIKLCVEVGEEKKDYRISIEYLSDEESKTVIRENNAIFNEWLVWSDLY